jgi:hypothetical protein
MPDPTPSAFDAGPLSRSGDELLAAGVPQILPGAQYRVAEQGYARIELDASGVQALDQPVVCLDIESLGFLGRPLFLVGAIYAGTQAPCGTPGDAPVGAPAPAGAGAVRMVQYLARDYSEEEAVVRAFVRDAGAIPTWVTFNGRSFDMPFLGLRAAYHRIPWAGPAQHIDLLPVARRLWGEQLPNCRLQTLERYICGRRPRGDDIAGAGIPRAYHDFVRTGEPWEMMRILYHNACDLATLLQLLRAALARGLPAWENAD